MLRLATPLQANTPESDMSHPDLSHALRKVVFLTDAGGLSRASIRYNKGLEATMNFLDPWTAAAPIVLRAHPGISESSSMRLSRSRISVA